MATEAKSRLDKLPKWAKAYVEDAVTMAALHETPSVEKDLPPPSGYELGLVSGWSHNEHSRVQPAVDVSCSSSVNHGRGVNTKTRSQRPIDQYSTRLLALRGLRNALEREYALVLRKIDIEIEKEEPPNEVDER